MGEIVDRVARVTFRVYAGPAAGTAFVVGLARDRQDDGAMYAHSHDGLERGRGTPPHHRRAAAGLRGRTSSEAPELGFYSSATLRTTPE